MGPPKVVEDSFQLCQFPEDWPTEDAEDSQEQHQDAEHSHAEDSAQLCLFPEHWEDAEDSQEQRPDGDWPTEDAEKPNMCKADARLADPHQMQADSTLLETPVTPTNFQQQADALRRDILRKTLDIPCAWSVYRDAQLSEEDAKKKEAEKKKAAAKAVASPARSRVPATPSASSVPPSKKARAKAKDGRKKAKEMVKKPQKSKACKRLKGIQLKKKLHSATPLHFIGG